MTGLIHYSTDATSNDVAAPPINWQEGMAAKEVNNSSREEMAALARWRDDNTGSLVASRGASDVYGVATNQIFDAASFARSHTLTFTVNAENQGPASLSPDGMSALPIRRPDYVDLAPRDLRPGVLYRVARLGPLYLLLSPTIAECGTIASFASSSVPAAWLSCDGRALSRVAYAALFQRIGATYGNGDGSTTFNIPDLRGRALFGVDGGTNRLTGAGGLGGIIGSAGGAETVSLTDAQLAAHRHGGSTGAAGAHDHGGSTGAAGNHAHGGGTGGGGDHSHSGTTNGGGGHSHSGSTDSAGAHSHGIQYRRLFNYRTDAASGGVDLLNSGDATVANLTGITDPNGAHAHGLTVNAAPDHTHGFNTSTVGQHTHTIAPDGQHSHSIAGVGDHAHGLSIDLAGGGEAHPNMPPGFVVTFAIKA